MRRITSPSVLLLCFVCSWAAAQDRPPRLEVFAEGGGSLLNSGPAQAIETINACPECATPINLISTEVIPLKSSISTTGRLFTGVRLRFTSHDAIEASYSFSPNRFVYSPEPGIVQAGYGRVSLFCVNYVRYLWARNRFQPFVTAGVGTNRFSGGLGTSPIQVGGLPESFEYSFSNPKSYGWQFAWNYGAGADLVLQRHFALRVQLRNYVSDQPTPLTGTSHNIVPSAGIVFRFK
jgi:hypothetical protein